MTQAVIDKYKIPVPHNTSYPPANYLPAFEEKECQEAVRLSNHADNRHLSFYLQMPFCRCLCHSCACNSYSMHNEATLFGPLKENATWSFPKTI